jgi:hypothetical protein
VLGGQRLLAGVGVGHQVPDAHGRHRGQQQGQVRGADGAGFDPFGREDVAGPRRDRNDGGSGHGQAAFRLSGGRHGPGARGPDPDRPRAVQRRDRAGPCTSRWPPPRPTWGRLLAKVSANDRAQLVMWPMKPAWCSRGSRVGEPRPVRHAPGNRFGGRCSRFSRAPSCCRSAAVSGARERRCCSSRMATASILAVRPDSVGQTRNTRRSRRWRCRSRGPWVGARSRRGAGPATRWGSSPMPVAVNQHAGDQVLGHAGQPGT